MHSSGARMQKRSTSRSETPFKALAMTDSPRAFSRSRACIDWSTLGSRAQSRVLWLTLRLPSLFSPVNRLVLPDSGALFRDTHANHTTPDLQLRKSLASHRQQFKEGPCERTDDKGWMWTEVSRVCSYLNPHACPMLCFASFSCVELSSVKSWKQYHDRVQAMV